MTAVVGGNKSSCHTNTVATVLQYMLITGCWCRSTHRHVCLLKSFRKSKDCLGLNFSNLQGLSIDHMRKSTVKGLFAFA